MMILTMARMKREGRGVCGALLGFALLLTLHGPLRAQENEAAISEFIVAAARGEIAVLARLLDAGLDPDVTSDKGLTALISTVMFDKSEAAMLLLRRGASVDHALPGGRTPLMIAARLDRGTALHLLLGAGADVGRRGPDGMTALLYAAQGDSPANVAALLDAGADPDIVDDTGKRTPLILAAASRQDAAVDVMTQLLGADAEPGLAAADGWTPLMAATLRAEPIRIKLLADYGADINAMTTDGRTALTVAAEQGNAAVTAYLISMKADPNGGGDSYDTPLGAAVKSRSLETVRVVVEAGARLENTGPDGKTPLVLAAGYQGYAIADYLLGKGADANAVNARDGTTALMWAANAGNRKMVERLLSAGARLTVKAHDGWTALQAARDAGHDDIARILDEQT